MPVRVVLCPCKALKWDISMWIEILKNGVITWEGYTDLRLRVSSYIIRIMIRPVDVKPIKEVLDSV